MNSNTNARPKPSARRKARKLALQALYQWQLSENEPATIEAQFAEDNNTAKVDMDYFGELVHSIPRQVNELDEIIKPQISRSLQEVDPIEKAILRIAAFELLQRQDIPYKVVINEAIELTKLFGATDGHKFVNGVVDKMALSLRTVETQHQQQKKK